MLHKKTIIVNSLPKALDLMDENSQKYTTVLVSTKTKKYTLQIFEDHGKRVAVR